jgi:hypothetical protein
VGDYIRRTIGLACLIAIGDLGCSSDSAAPAGAPGSDGATTGTDAGAPADGAPFSACTISVQSATYSPIIGTVGIVTWSTTFPNVDRAQIDFGLDDRYGLTAPVDLTQMDHRTLLLGMKQNAGPYHFRISAWAGSALCASADQLFDSKTGASPGDLTPPTVTTYDATSLDGGFLLTVGYDANSPDDYVFILDGDGDIAWWYQPTGFADLSAALMSYDGQYMWMAHTNVPQVEARVGRVLMDGSGFEDLRSEFENQDHDFAVLPDGDVIYMSYQWNECDDIVEWSPDGTNRLIINSSVPFGDAFICHTNAIQYSPWDDTVVVSDDDHSGYFKVDRQGNVIWVLGGGDSNSFDLAGGGASGWSGNHNLHLLSLDDLVFFNNGVDGVVGGVPAVARELKLDLVAMTTSETWSYTADPTIANPILGDVQRLPNGNTIVDYSVAGVVQEVSSAGNVLQQLTWGPNKPIGYFTKRKTLYGPPPR